MTRRHESVVSAFLQHRDWNHEQGWKNGEQSRLRLLPWVSYNALKPWIAVFHVPKLAEGFDALVERMNFQGASVSSKNISFLLLLPRVNKER